MSKPENFHPGAAPPDRATHDDPGSALEKAAARSKPVRSAPEKDSRPDGSGNITVQPVDLGRLRVGAQSDAPAGIGGIVRPVAPPDRKGVLQSSLQPDVSDHQGEGGAAFEPANAEEWLKLVQGMSRPGGRAEDGGSWSDASLLPTPEVGTSDGNALALDLGRVVSSLGGTTQSEGRFTIEVGSLGLIDGHININGDSARVWLSPRSAATRAALQRRLPMLEQSASGYAGFNIQLEIA